MAFTVAFHPGAPLLLGGRRPIGAAAAATWHLPGPRASRRGQAPAHHRPAVRMATAPGGGGGDGDGASGDDVDATGARKPRGDPEWLDMAKQVGGRDGDGGGRKRGRSFWPFGGGKAAAKAEADDEEESRPAPKWVIPDGYGEEALGGGAPAESSAWQIWSGALDREADAPPPAPRDGKAEVDFWRSSAKEVVPPTEGAPAAGGEPSGSSEPPSASLPPPPPPTPPPPPPAASVDAGPGAAPSRSSVADATPPDDPAGLWGMARAVTGEVADLQQRLQEEVTSYDLGSNATAYRDFARGVYEANRGEDAPPPPPPPPAAGARGWGGGGQGDAAGSPLGSGGAGGFADVIYTDSSGRVLSAAEVEEAFSTGAVFVDDDGNEVPPEDLLPRSSSAFGGRDAGTPARWESPPPPTGEATPATAPAAFESKGLPPPAPPTLPRRPPSTSTYGGGWDGADEALRELQAEGVPLRDPASETAFWRAAAKDIELPEPVTQDPPPAAGGVAAAGDSVPPASPAEGLSSPMGGPSSGLSGWADFASSLDDAAAPPAEEPSSSSTVEVVSAEQMEMFEAAARVRGGGGAAAADNGAAATGADADADVPTFSVSLDDDTFSAFTSGVPFDSDSSASAASAPPPPAAAVTPPPPVGEEVTSAWSSWSSASSRWEEKVSAAPPRDPKAEVDQWRSAARDLTDPPPADSGDDAPWESSTSFGGGGVASDWGVGLDSEATSERARWGAWDSSSPLGSGSGGSGFGTTWARPGEVRGRKRDKAAGAAKPSDAPSSAATWLDAARDLTAGAGADAAAAASAGGTTSPADTTGAYTGPAGGGFVFDPTAVAGRAPPGKGADIDQWRTAAQDVAVPPTEDGEEGKGGGADATA